MFQPVVLVLSHFKKAKSYRPLQSSIFQQFRNEVA